MSEQLYRFEITGDLDRTTAEALRLEIRRLAKQYGLNIEAFRIETPEKSASA